MTLRPLRGFILQPRNPQLSETLAPLTHPGGSRPEFLGNLMRRLTLSAPQNYLGALHLALLCLSGFNPSIQLVCLFRTKFDLGRHSTHPGIPSYIAYFCNEVLDDRVRASSTIGQQRGEASNGGHGGEK